jgi:hypothetical protein
MFQSLNNLAGRAAWAVALGCGLLAQAGEKVELRGSTTIELPKPERKIDEERRFKFDNGASELSGGFAAPVGVGNSNAALDQKMRQMLDRKKNWIFVNPYEMNLDERTTEILGKDQATGSLMDHHLLKEGEKSTMQKFFEERDTRRSNDEATEDRGRKESDFSPASIASDDPEEMRDGRAPKTERNAVLFLSPRDNSGFREPGFDTDSFEKRMERTPLDGSVFARSGAQRPELDREEFKKQQETREAEFEKFLQPRTTPGGSAIGGLSGRLDPLNTASDSTRQEANPAAARRTDSFLSSSPNRIDFSGGSGALAGGAPGAGFDFDPGTRAAPSGGFLQSTAPSAAPAAQTRAPAPFVFEFPRRKF